MTDERFEELVNKSKVLADNVADYWTEGDKFRAFEVIFVRFLANEYRNETNSAGYHYGYGGASFVPNVFNEAAAGSSEYFPSPTSFTAEPASGNTITLDG